MGLTFWNPNIQHFMQKNAILEQVKAAEEDDNHMLQFFKKQKLMYTKLVPETVHCINFIWKFI